MVVFNVLCLNVESNTNNSNLRMRMVGFALLKGVAHRYHREHEDLEKYKGQRVKMGKNKFR